MPSNPDYTPLVPDRKPLNQVKFAGKDFPSIFDAILRRLKEEYKDVYNDYATTSVGIMLIDLMSYATAQLIWYLDRVSSDCFLDTARTRAAVARLVKQIGYKLGSATAASTTEYITFPDGAPAAFTLQRGFQFQGPSNLIFETYADKLLAPPPAPGDVVQVAIRQGETRTLIYTADGSPNQSYRMTNIPTDRYLAENSVEVWVDGSPWEEVLFLEYEKTDQYEVGYNDDPPTIQFGDGVAGNIPPDGAEVKIRFVIIDGVKGNVKAHTIQTAIDSVTIAGVAVPIEVDNPYGPSGGTDPEDIERAKKLAPFSFAARGAAITLNDYVALSNSYSDPMYGRVAKAYAFNPRAPYEDAVFNSMIGAIEALLTDYRAVVDSVEDAIVSGATSMDDIVVSMQTDSADLLTLITDMIGYLQSAESQMEGARQSNALYGNIIDDIQSQLDYLTDPFPIGIIESLKDYVNSTSASSGEKTNINNALDGITGVLSGIYDMTSQLESKQATTAGAIDASLGFIFNARDDTENASPPAPKKTLSSIQAANDANLAALSDLLTDPTTGIIVNAQSINGTAATLETNIVDVLDQMHTRIGELFDADCLSNYVQVPILAYDAEGNYVAPSAGLMIGLQTYLNGIKEVTQDVEVIDGSFNLVPAQIQMQLKVDPNAVESEVTSQIEATIQGILRGRDFNQPLYLDWVYKNVKEIPGITYVNIEILGPAAYLDTEGNLVPAPTQIITFGSLNIGVL